MKHIITTISIIILFISCKEKADKPAAPVTQKDSVATVMAKKDFSHVNFAARKDLSCGMPLTAGLEDSVHYRGKIYGFCSPECKADFVKNAATYVK